MLKLIETTRNAEVFSQIYPMLKIWKKSIRSRLAFIGFDEMAQAASAFLESAGGLFYEAKIFNQSVALTKRWRSETEKQFQINFGKNADCFQIDYAFPFAPPFEHIVEAENRMLIVCLLCAVKDFDERKLSAEFEIFKKAHERHWTVGLLSQTSGFATTENPELSYELRTFSALSFI